MSEYIVTAYSRSQNTHQREINLMSQHPSTRADAQQHADSFAHRLNQQQFLSTQDWVGQIELVDSNSVRTQ